VTLDGHYGKMKTVKKKEGGEFPLHMKYIGFLTLNTRFHILAAPMGSMSFVKSFVVKAFQEDFDTIVNILMFVNLQAHF